MKIFSFFFIFVGFCTCVCEAIEEHQNLNFESYAFVKDIALIQLSFDGINTLHCGVGQVVLQTQDVLKRVNQQYQDQLHFKLYLLSGNYSPQLPEYSTKTLVQNRMDCQESGGEVCLLPLTKREQMFGDPEQWQELCEAGALECARIINENVFTIIIAHDSAYAQLPLQLRNLLLKGAIYKPYQIVWVPHATSWSYNGHTPNGIAKWPQRHEWELKSFQQAAMNNYRIGYISETIKDNILKSPFNVPESALFPYRTGIILDPYLQSIPEDVVAMELSKRNIPLDKKLIFSIGRANPLKGQDITLEMYRHLKNAYSDIHMVMLAPPSDYMPSYLKLLKDRIKREQLDVTLIDYFDSKLANFIYQWPKTVLVSLLSRMDTRPLTVMEARVNPKNSVVLVSDPERIGQQVSNEIDGFICSLEGLDTIIDQPIPYSGAIERIANCAKQLLELSSFERKKIVDAGKALISQSYDLNKNMIANFIDLFKLHQNTLLAINQNSRTLPDFDCVLELASHSEKIKELYSLPGHLFFEKLTGGIANPPIVVFNQTQEGQVPLGVFKFETGDIQLAALRLKVLSEMKSRSFPHLPLIFQDKEGRYLVDIGEHFYSFIEFLPQDSHSISFEDILKMTGEFHRDVRSSSLPELLKISKLNEYQKRCSGFSDPWFKEYRPDIFLTPFWNTIIEMSLFFASEEFRLLYEQLPSQLIHGDNNQTNVVLSHEIPYMIDFDAVRIDARLLDLTSYFRYGGFDQYIHLTKEEKLISTINSMYGKRAGKLNSLEKNSLHLMVIFSCIEFISWTLEKLKQDVINGDQKRDQEYIAYIEEYTEKIRRLRPFTKDDFEMFAKQLKSK